MFKNSENDDTPLPHPFNENYSSFLYGDIDPNKDHHQRNYNQQFQYPQIHSKKNRITDSFSPINTNFLSINIWNESPLNNLRNLTSENANDHFDDVNVYQMFKNEAIATNNNIKNNMMPKKKVSNLNSVSIKLDFNDFEFQQRGKRQQNTIIEKKYPISKSNIQQTVKKGHKNKINIEQSQSSKKSKQVINDNLQSTTNKKRNQKGLRNLSETVRQIVQEAKVTTYKEVAEKLINKLDQQNKINLDPNSKDEQNVKRRVYDALNVLIAAKILRKQGKNVMAETQKNKLKKGEKQHYENQLLKLTDNVRKTKFTVLQKYEKMQNLRKKYISISNLIARNKDLSKTKKQTNDQRKIRFPFIGVMFKLNSLDQQQSILRKNCLIFKFSYIPKIIGDIDTLLKLNNIIDSQKCKLPQQIMDYKCQLLKVQQQENQMLSSQ